MPEYVAITIRIPHQTWEVIHRSTLELRGRAREQEMADVVFYAYAHAAMLLDRR